MLSICVVLCNPIVLYVCMTLHQVGSSSLMCALYCQHVEVAMMFLLEQGSMLHCIVVLDIPLLNALVLNEGYILTMIYIYIYIYMYV